MTSIRATCLTHFLARLALALVLLVPSLPVMAQTNDEDVDGETAAPQKDKKKNARKVEIQAPYVLIDATTGEVLAEDRAGEPWYPASLSKLMTAYVVFHKLRQGKLKLDQEITVSPLASSQEPSKIGVPAGKTVSVDFALQALLIYSANDMAYVLAEAAAGSIANFSDEMNAAANRLGLSASHFVNPNGLFDPRQISSARDMAVLSAVMFTEFPEHTAYFKQQYLTVGKRKLPNRNRLVRTMPEADGMKTGFVCASGFNLVASANREGRRLIAVVMGYKNGFLRAEAAHALLVEGFAKPRPDAAKKVADLANLPQGAIVPSDMTSTVCKNKPPVTVKDGITLSGWAISFGTYDTPLKADMALRGRLLSPHVINIKGTTGVIQLPEKAGYGAWMWNLDQPTVKSVCQSYRIDGTHCEVIPTEILAKMAAQAKVRKAAVEAARADTSDLARAAKLRKLYKRQFGH